MSPWNAVQAERDENIAREPLPTAELVAMGKRLEKLEKAEAKARQKAGGGKSGSGKLPEPVPQARDKVAAALFFTSRMSRPITPGIRFACTHVPT